MATDTLTVISVAVGSKNPVKVNAVKMAFQAHLDKLGPFSSSEAERIRCSLSVTGYSVPSNVPDQPRGDYETRQGAINRALASWDAHAAAHGGEPPRFAVGLEGGVGDDTQSQMHPDVEGLPDVAVQCFAWMVILSKDAAGGTNIWGAARTASFPLPEKIVQLMNEGMELGDADDAVFNDTNSKQKGGTVGKLTHGAIDRTAYYVHALHMALIPFLHDDAGLYSQCQN